MSAASASAAEGLPDPTFGSGGFALIDEPALTDERLEDLFIQPDGKILMAGTRGAAAGFLLARFNANGTPDLSFGPEGIKVEPDTAIEGAPRGINDIARRTDGKIVAVGLGRGKDGTDAFGFARYFSNGNLDSEFGTNGLTTLSPGEPGEPGEGVAVDLAPGGKIVAAGFESLGSTAAVLRLTENGEPDSTFAPAAPVGFRIFKVPGSAGSGAYAVKVLGDGTSVVGGWSDAGAFLTELDQHGEPVAGFGTAGFFVQDLGQDSDPSGEFTGLAVQPDGRIVAVGISETATEDDEQLVVARFTAGGDLDPSFGSGGIFRLNPTPNEDGGEALEVLPDGRILVAGFRGAISDAASGDTWLVRLTPGGQLDPSFGTGGQTFASAAAGFDGAYGLAVQPDGKPVIVGEATEGTGPFVMLAGRFTGPEPVKVSVVPTKARCAGKDATITGTAEADKLKGTKKADVIAGLGSNDRVSALAGNDLVCGGGGKDTIVLGKGRDEGRGEGGADTLKGGPGKDKLLGANGKDKLLGGPGPDLCNGGAGKDPKSAGCETRKKLP